MTDNCERYLVENIDTFCSSTKKIVRSHRSNRFLAPPLLRHIPIRESGKYQLDCTKRKEKRSLCVMLSVDRADGLENRHQCLAIIIKLLILSFFCAVEINTSTWVVKDCYRWPLERNKKSMFSRTVFECIVTLDHSIRHIFTSSFGPPIYTNSCVEEKNSQFHVSNQTGNRQIILWILVFRLSPGKQKKKYCN